MKWLACLGLVAMTFRFAAAAPYGSPYDRGRFEVDVGFYRQTGGLSGVRIGGGYFAVTGLELGVAGTHFWGQPAGVDEFTPFVTYYFTGWYESVPLAPYIGASYEHRWTDPNYYVPDALDARVGLALTVSTGGHSVTFGGGIVLDHPIEECGFGDCSRYPPNGDSVSPQVFVALGF